MKKAFKWLDAQKVAYDFVDYKKNGADENILRDAIQTHGWETAINKRGTTWRQLPDHVKTAMNADKAIAIALENPSIIKRPLLIRNGESYIGFQPDMYEEIFG